MALVLHLFFNGDFFRKESKAAQYQVIRPINALSYFSYYSVASLPPIPRPGYSKPRPRLIKELARGQQAFLFFFYRGAGDFFVSQRNKRKPGNRPRAFGPAGGDIGGEVVDSFQRKESTTSLSVMMKSSP